MTEFEYPDQLPRLLTTLQIEVMQPLRARLKETDAQAEKSRCACRSEMQRQTNQISERLKHYQMALADIRKNSQVLESQFRSKGLGIPEEQRKNPITPMENHGLDNVIQEAAHAFQQAQELISGPLADFSRPRTTFLKSSPVYWLIGIFIDVVLWIHIAKTPIYPTITEFAVAIILGFLLLISAILYFGTMAEGLKNRIPGVLSHSQAVRLVTAACAKMNECVAAMESATPKHIEKLRSDLTTVAQQRQTRLENIEEGIHGAKVQLTEEFTARVAQMHRAVDAYWNDTHLASAEWSDPGWLKWKPDPSPEFAARIGMFVLHAHDLESAFPTIDFQFKLPALIPFAEGRCFLLSAAGKAKQAAADALISAVVRVLANTPPGKARFTFIDPVGLGQNVADFMHLGDFNKDLIGGKAWSEPQHIEQQLILLTEHIETVIQSCLRKDFATIRDYNRERHEVAQPFRFVVVNDFPVNFTEASARRLVSIVKNGPRCGVFTFIMRDTEKKLPYGFDLHDLENAATEIAFLGDKLPGENTQIGAFVWQGADFENFTLLLDGLPPQDITGAIVKKSGEQAITAMKVEVPFEKLLAVASLEKNSWWTASTAENLKVPIGPAGARAVQELTLGGEQEAHVLMVGRTGSGKTNLMHVIITALALKYPPKEVQLYLIDFKGGVGFKRYAEYQLPHARVIAIESEREFGMSVLRGLDAELKQRSDIFRAAGVDNLTSFRAKIKSEKPDADPMPRILLVVDEFQEFFTENDDMAQQAKIIFDRLARQGRSFGVHFLLATQSLAGSAQLPSSIMGQIKVRIALPCSETDSRLILADDNKAARALSLPGEAIYNPLGGLIEGNNRFQVARFSDNDLLTYLAAISETARDGHAPIIFEGNEPAHVEDCVQLKELLHAPDWPEKVKGVDVFLGEPIAIMPPVAARLRRQSGGNLMILARDESEGMGICMSALLNVLALQQPGRIRIFIADFTAADSEWAGHAQAIADSFPGEIAIVRRQREIVSLFAAIAKELQSRSENASAHASIYLFLQGMHRIKSLRDDAEDEDGHNSVELLKTILRDGPELGIHVVAWADTWGNITRGLDRRTVGEFGLRVAAVMDSGDSMNFLDNLAASKLSKPHRAIFYDEDRPGQLVLFRPYAMPPVTWLKETGQRLQSRIEKPTDTHQNPSL